MSRYSFLFRELPFGFGFTDRGCCGGGGGGGEAKYGAGRGCGFGIV